MRIKYLSLGLGTLFIFSACSKSQGEGQQSAPYFETEELVSTNAVQEFVYPVVIKGKNDAEIRPRVSGFIEKILVDEGSVVKKGQTLFTIDSPDTESALRSAEASVNSAKAAVNTAKVDVDRMRPLVEKGIISPVNLQTAENTYQSALATLAQAEANLTNARASRSWASVSSPIDGVVGTIPYRKGNLVSSSYALTTVSDISQVYANFSINEKELSTLFNNLKGNTIQEKLRGLSNIRLRLADGQEFPYEGRIETVSGVVDAVTGSVNLRAEFNNPDKQLLSGSSGSIVIQLPLDSVLVISQNVTFNRQDKVLVYKVQGDSVLQTVVQVLPLPDGQNYAILGGIEPGDRIVKSGVLSLYEGMKISTQK